MKFKIIAFTFLVAMAGFLVTSCGKKPSATGKPDNVDYYTCTMHPSVRSQKPGDKCPICGMDLVPVYKQSAITNTPAVSAESTDQIGAAKPGVRKIKFYQSTMSPKETSPTPARDSMGMEMDPVYEEANAAENRPGEFFVAVNRQQEIGVTYATIEKQSLQQTIRSAGIVAYEIPRHRDFIAPAQGSVMSLDVASPGEMVEKDQPLLTIYSPDLLAAEKEFAAAAATYEVTPLVGTFRMVQNVKVQYEAAKHRLWLWNVSTNQIAELEKWRTQVPQDTVAILSPFRGVVERIGVEPGKNVNAGDELVEIADLRAVWVWADFYQDELSLLKTNLPISITTSSYPGDVFPGKIAVIDPFIDPVKRTVRVRIDLENPDLKLRPEMYVNAELKINGGEQLAVPINAVLPTGQHNIVFVDQGGGKLEPRFVQLGRQFGNLYQVQSGLSEGERVVDSANFLIDAESQIQGALKSWESN